jgi:hypothetical protein
MNRFNCYIIYQDDGKLEVEHFYGNAWVLQRRMMALETTQIEVIRGHQQLAHFSKVGDDVVALWKDIPNTGV